MNNPQKKYFNSLEMYYENLDVLWNKEEEYKILLVKRFEDYIEKIKKDFKRYCKQNNYKIIVRNSFIEAKYGDNYLVIRIDFNEVYPAEKHELNLAIVEVHKPRREYHVTIRPKVDELYIPKRSITVTRPKPQNDVQAKEFIKSIGENILILDDKIQELKQISFILNCHDAKYSPSKDEKLKIYNDFISILENLFNN